MAARVLDLEGIDAHGLSYATPRGASKGCNKGAALRKARRKTGGNFRPPLQGRGRQRGLR